MNYSASDHTFVICAYGKSIYLEECIKSVKNQRLDTKVLICTSTPSRFLEEIAKKHGLPLYINSEKENNSDIATDWNFAIDCADTPLVTLVHQDDVYKEDFSHRVLLMINKSPKPLIAFTDYSEIRNGREISNIRNLNIKRLMLFPLRFRCMWGFRFLRRRILSFGTPISCPTVTYIKPNLPSQLFVSGYKVSLDWQAWEKLSRLDGDFVYVNDILMSHRIHEASETTKNINDNTRTREDYEMFCKFWPKEIAKVMEYIYKNGEKQNRL